jgi:hypothetical protein
MVQRTSGGKEMRGMAGAVARGYDTDLTDEQWALVEPFVRAEYSGLGP